MVFGNLVFRFSVNLLIISPYTQSNDRVMNTVYTAIRDDLDEKCFVCTIEDRSTRNAQYTYTRSKTGTGKTTSRNGKHLIFM